MNVCIINLTLSLLFSPPHNRGEISLLASERQAKQSRKKEEVETYKARMNSASFAFVLSPFPANDDEEEASVGVWGALKVGRKMGAP